MFTCPVCFYDRLVEEPANYNICICCGTEFGNDDSDKSHEELRHDWIAAGTPWFFAPNPTRWNAFRQLYRASYAHVPYVGAMLSPNNSTTHVATVSHIPLMFGYSSAHVPLAQAC